MRIIDAVAYCKELILERDYPNRSEEFIKAIEVAIADLGDMPTIDAVEVVRCKDCLHYELGVCLKIYSDGAVSEYAWQARNEEDFCSYGERR